MLCMVLTRQTRNKIVLTIIGITIVFIVHTQKSFQPIEPIDILHLWIGVIIVGMVVILFLPSE